MAWSLYHAYAGSMHHIDRFKLDQVSVISYIVESSTSSILLLFTK